jgi:pyruvate,water dikinase
VAGPGRLLEELLTRDPRVAELAARWLDLATLLGVRRRRIGGGLLGGKAAGLLIARAILARADPSWRERLEPLDAWFVGADVYRDVLARCGAWQDDPAERRRALRERAAELRARVRAAAFPAAVVARLEELLAHYGEAPLVVRSSSLLEDGFGSAFTGKYASLFLANRGTRQARLAALLDALREVYASALGDEALRYRERRGLLDEDERMAVLVQRVSGSARGGLFFPHVAGVALSYNPWAWDAEIDPRAGMARIVFGLGTRAVERSGDDYTRLVALDAPLARAESHGDAAEHAQRRVDVLDLAAGRLEARPFEELARAIPELPLDLFASRPPGGPPVLTFEKLLAASPFAEWVRGMVRTLADAHRFPIEVELTGNFDRAGRLRLNLVQCRPLRVVPGGEAQRAPEVGEEAVVLASRGPIVGRSRSTPVDRVILVDPDAYDGLDAAARVEVARLVGRVTALGAAARLRVLLLGPGRWGTRTLSAGVPTTFAEIQPVSAVCEVVRAGARGAPEASLGSHFFDELVEADMLYLAVQLGRPGHRLAGELLRGAPNRLPALLPADARWAEVVHVVDFPHAREPRALRLSADFVRQQVVCWLAAAEPAGDA